jgi:hypothetical protein
MAPSEALVRLEDERLLSWYAAEHGYGEGRDVARELKRARVRALLRTAVEEGNAPADMRPEDVRARFEELRARRELPERRRVSHALFAAKTPDEQKAVRGAAEALRAELGTAGTTADMAAKLASLGARPEYLGKPLKVEQFEVRPDSKLEAPFLAAVLARSEPGPVPTLVTTSYGLHVIVVEEVLPPLKLRFEEHEREIREQLSNERRAKVLDALIAELREKDSVKLDEASVRKALSDDRLLGELR